MKKNIIFLISILSVLTLMSCEDFLDRKPLTEITIDDFFNNAQDLETYTNGFYKFLSISFDDVGSDNVSISTNSNTMYNMVNGDAVTSSNISGWDKADWEKLRNINFFLNNIDRDKINALPEDINHYVGIARFFRADYYYKKVKDYSAVPWYNKSMDVDDPDLYMGSSPRTQVIDSVLTDLEYAAKHIKPDIGSRTRINQYTALALMARICLHEGTFRKYHTELKLEHTAEAFFDKAIWACEEIMNSNKFSIYGSSGADYGAMFCALKLKDNPEMILVEETSEEVGKANNTHTVLGLYWGLSRSLMEDYLTDTGQLYSNINASGDVKSYLEVFENRDPRFKETFAYPGFKESETSKPYLTKLTLGGYIQLKFFPKDVNQRQGWNRNYTSVPLYRYGEILLIYAEAKAEKGNLTQADLDKSVNLLRKRVQMPDIIYSSNIISDIRRERRVELACEGFRLDDLKRWAEGRLLGEKPQGIHIFGFGAFDTTGDGIVDSALLPSPDNTSAIEHLPEEVKKNLNISYLINENGKSTGISLSGEDGKSGYIEFETSKNRKWQDKYYYIPIPKRQTILNPKLQQPPGWEE